MRKNFVIVVTALVFAFPWRGVVASMGPRIANLTAAQQPGTRADIMDAFQISSTSANRLLADMVGQGLIQAEGTGRGTRYRVVGTRGVDGGR